MRLCLRCKCCERGRGLGGLIGRRRWEVGVEVGDWREGRVKEGREMRVCKVRIGCLSHEFSRHEACTERYSLPVFCFSAG